MLALFSKAVMRVPSVTTCSSHSFTIMGLREAEWLLNIYALDLSSVEISKDILIILYLNRRSKKITPRLCKSQNYQDSNMRF